MSGYDKQLKKTALLVSATVILQIAESFFPQVVPGVKLGLANMIVLVAMVNLGFKAALEIAVMRTLISSLILGTFLSPAFVLSFSSAIISTLVMGGLYRLSSGNGKVFLSLIGISVIGALAHNLTQISLVYLLLIKNQGIFLLLPWLGMSSVITGFITGIIASGACKALGKRQGAEKAADFMRAPGNKSGTGGLSMGRYIQKKSVIHSLSPEIKILTVAALAVFMLALDNVYAYAAVMILLLAAGAASKVPIMRFFDGVRRMYFFILISLLMPALFTAGGHAIFAAGPVRVTAEGVNSGVMFAFRLVILMTAAAVMIRTTSPAQMAEGIRKILKPLSFTGISGERASRIAASSLEAVPALWDRAKAMISGMKISGRRPGEIITAISVFVAALYLSAEDKII